MADIVLKRGDRSPSVTATLRQAGVPIDLTGASVVFVMRSKSGQAPAKVNAAATIVTPASGIVRYDWIAGDVDTAGLFYAEFKVTLTGKVVTCPNTGHLEVTILDDLD